MLLPMPLMSMQQLQQHLCQQHSLPSSMLKALSPMHSDSSSRMSGSTQQQHRTAAAGSTRSSTQQI